MRDLCGNADVGPAVKVSHVIAGETRWVFDAKIVLGHIKRHANVPLEEGDTR